MCRMGGSSWYYTRMRLLLFWIKSSTKIFFLWKLLLLNYCLGILYLSFLLDLEVGKIYYFFVLFLHFRLGSAPLNGRLSLFCLSCTFTLGHWLVLVCWAPSFHIQLDVSLLLQLSSKQKLPDRGSEDLGREEKATVVAAIGGQHRDEN